MGRQYKFRAWDKKDFKIRKVLGMSFEHDTISVKLNDEEYLQDDASRFELMQYTGLKDKNGTEIYEGDILYVDQIGTVDRYLPNKKNIGVRYDESDTSFVYDEDNGMVIGLFTLQDELKIVGNIYENPELLEVSS